MGVSTPCRAFAPPLTTRVVVAVAFVAAAVGSAAAADLRVAGVEPDRRPVGAPSIEAVEKSAAWQRRASTGITKPLPGSVPQILSDQGNWHTPFDHPGMTGPYDIRGWHAD